jgi:hypothetical protein
MAGFPEGYHPACVAERRNVARAATALSDRMNKLSMFLQTTDGCSTEIAPTPLLLWKSAYA